MQRHWYVGLAALVSMVGARHQAMAQPDPHEVAKAANPPVRQRNAARRLKADKLVLGPKTADREIAQLEAMQGKPLTDKQQQAITQSLAARNEIIIAAQKNYQTEVAQALGLTAADLLAKRRAYLKAHRDGQALDQTAVKK